MHEGTRWRPFSFIRNSAAFLVGLKFTHELAAFEYNGWTSVESASAQIFVARCSPSHDTKMWLWYTVLPWQWLTWDVKDFSFEDTFSQLTKKHAMATPKEIFHFTCPTTSFFKRKWALQNVCRQVEPPPGKVEGSTISWSWVRETCTRSALNVLNFLKQPLFTHGMLILWTFWWILWCDSYLYKFHKGAWQAWQRNMTIKQHPHWSRLQECVPGLTVPTM